MACAWKPDYCAVEDTRPIQKTFAVVQVSRRAHDLIRNLEQSAGAAAMASVGELDVAYELLNADRRKLYQYIDGLERKLKITRSIVKRF